MESGRYMFIIYKTYLSHITFMVIIFLKYWKFYVDFKNAIKFPENLDGFEGNCV